MLQSHSNKDVMVLKFTHWYHEPDLTYNQMVKDHLLIWSVHKGYQVVAILSTCISQAPLTKHVCLDFWASLQCWWFLRQFGGELSAACPSLFVSWRLVSPAVTLLVLFWSYASEASDPGVEVWPWFQQNNLSQTVVFCAWSHMYNCFDFDWRVGKLSESLLLSVWDWNKRHYSSVFEVGTNHQG